MKRRFVLTPEARSDLREILLDIAEDSPDTAERLRTEFYDGLQALVDDRLLDLAHASRLDQLEQAFAVIGKRLEVAASDAEGGCLWSEEGPLALVLYALRFSVISLKNRG